MSTIDKYSFSGHETFPFRYTWLPKAIQNLVRYPDLFTREDAIIILGVGKNMVASIRHWCEALSLIEPKSKGKEMQPTRLGSALFEPDGWDPYLEDPGTLWLLHWLLVRRKERASAWYLAFTRYHEETFTPESLRQWLEALIQQNPGNRATSSSLKRDIGVFLRTYTPSQLRRDGPLEDSFDCPLVELGLIRPIDHELYQFVRGPKPSLPEAIFVYALIDFWRATAQEQRTLSFERILHAPGSPGKAFKLSENALSERLERLPSWSDLHYDHTAGMRMILQQSTVNKPDPFIALSAYYPDIALEIPA